MGDSAYRTGVFNDIGDKGIHIQWGYHTNRSCVSVYRSHTISLNTHWESPSGVRREKCREAIKTGVS